MRVSHDRLHRFSTAATTGIVAAALLCLLTMADVVIAHELVPPQLPPPAQAALTAGPYNFEFTGEDALRLTTHNSLAGVSVRVSGRIRRRDGSIAAIDFVQVPNTDRTAKTSDFAIGEGYLLNLTVEASAGAPKVGQTFVRLRVIRGFSGATIAIGTLVQGYVTGNQDRAWPGSPIDDSISSGGVVRTVQGTNPAAGVACFDVVPAGARWQVLSYAVGVITSAAAGTRAIRVFLSSTIKPYVELVQAGTMGPSAANSFYWGTGLTIDTVIGSGPFFQGLPIDCPLLAGNAIGTNATNFDAGDDFEAPQIQVREWLEAS